MDEIKNIPQNSPASPKNSFGFDAKGYLYHSYKLTNASGAVLMATDYGATVVSLQIPSNSGLTDVVLGFDRVEDYIDSFSLPSAPYLGATVGRYAGRIGKARFFLNGDLFLLAPNNGENALHGGLKGLARTRWNGRYAGNDSLVFECLSPAGEDGYPGNVQFTVTYTLTDDNALLVDYHATTDADTVVNLAHHSYFNLDGHDQEVTGQQLQLSATTYLETDAANVPTGSIKRVAGTILDFTKARPCPESIDHTFPIADHDGPCAILSSTKTGLQLEVHTSQPALHIYVGGNCFGKITGKNGAAYHPLSGICFETQNYPDAPNQPHFPSAVLKKGETHQHRTRYQFKNNTL